MDYRNLRKLIDMFNENKLSKVELAYGIGLWQNRTNIDDLFKTVIPDSGKVYLSNRWQIESCFNFSVNKL